MGQSPARRENNQNKIRRQDYVTDNYRCRVFGRLHVALYVQHGERRKVDLTPLLVYPAFEELRDKNEFIQFGLDQTIFWKNGADIAPERLYELGVAA